MRSAFICVFFTLIVQRGSRGADDDFRPTPIPLGEWHHDKPSQDFKPSTLLENTNSEAPPTIAAVPAHYWEDALRHSVYLTLVRDKIDQLIAKGDVISPDSKPDEINSKENDDHDLWDKIKTAPFDRIKSEEPASYGDVTIMAKGRLLEERGRLRFIEDKRSHEKCADDKCTEGVKAFWSVKRVRQRDMETSPARYHYELTFSVISQTPKKQKKPYENPVRTFTVRETDPERVVNMPRESRSYERTPIPQNRPERVIWFHKNIVPTQRYSGRQYQHGLDRIFSSFFTDEEEVYTQPQRYRPSPHMPPVYSQYSKVGYVGSPSDQQKKLTPYPYKPHSYKYSRPPLPPPPYSHSQHHYLDTEAFGVSQSHFGPPQDYRYMAPNKQIKTAKPVVSPTSNIPVLPPKNWTVDEDKQNTNTADNITKVPEMQKAYKSYNKPRPPPMKINYLSDHVRPPIYNAPPGVFVTMDKKPFKPMPPLKLVHSSKAPKLNRPVDFRPSPQVLDLQQFSEPDPLFDSPFRPITWNYSDTSTTEKLEVAESSTHNSTRKQSPKSKKPPKKHENIKSQRSTTTTPEIITASGDSSEDGEPLQWVNIVGAFSKTTPMVSHKEKTNVSETTTSPSTTSTVPSTTVRKRTTTTEAIAETTVSTTPRPKKRTRPPPKFSKPDKIKKHKRITTTSTKAPEIKSTQDLTPQASSAATNKPVWNTTSRPLSTTTTPTTTTTTITTTKPTTTTRTTTTTQATNTATTETRFSTMTSQPKGINRFRQSTLMQKGTSVKHDRWSTPNVEKTRTSQVTNKPRRKGSNFQGYASTSTNKYLDKESHEIYHSTSTVNNALQITPISKTTPTYEETADQYENNGESSDYSNQDEDIDDSSYEESDEQETKDHTEYIFQSTAPSEKTNEIIDHEEPVTEQITTTAFSIPKNKTKCNKKKNHQNVTNTEFPKESSSPSTTTTTTESPVTPSILEELFGGFTLDESTEEKESKSTEKPELEKQESEHHAQFVKLDDDLQEFLDSLNKGENRSDDGAEYDSQDDHDSLIEDSPFENDEDNPSPRTDDSYDEYQDRPYSLLELMAME